MVSLNLIRKLMSVISGMVCGRGEEGTEHPQKEAKSPPRLQSC